MKINTVELTKITTNKNQYPKDTKPEFLLLGRSNVGKSSFINTIVNRKNYAKTSSTPGKTKTLNFYLINDEFYLVDAPGYGFAKVSEKEKIRFGKMIEEYINSRKNFKAVFLLIDFRHLPTEDDKLMYDYLKYYNLDVILVATKKDKVKRSDYIKNEKEIKTKLNLTKDDILISFSSKTNEGRSEILSIIKNYL